MNAADYADLFPQWSGQFGRAARKVSQLCSLVQLGLIKVMNNFYTSSNFGLTCTLKNEVAHKFYISLVLKKKEEEIKNFNGTFDMCGILEVCFGALFGTFWKLSRESPQEAKWKGLGSLHPRYPADLTL